MNKENRYYQVGQKNYPSVTTITSLLSKPALYYWFGKHGNEKCKKISEESLKIGQELHDFINKYFTRGFDEQPSTVCQQNFVKFLEQYKPQLVMTEQVVYSLEHGYAGTLDAVLKIGDKTVLVDWKTSSSFYEDYALQVIAYYEALTELYINGILKLERKIDELWVVRFDKEKEFNSTKDIHKVEISEVTFRAFLGLLDVFKWKYKEELSNADNNKTTNRKTRRNNSKKISSEAS